jgi:hypothetical protein
VNTSNITIRRDPDLLTVALGGPNSVPIWPEFHAAGRQRSIGQLDLVVRFTRPLDLVRFGERQSRYSAPVEPRLSQPTARKCARISGATALTNNKCSRMRRSSIRTASAHERRRRRSDVLEQCEAAAELGITTARASSKRA